MIDIRNLAKRCDVDIKRGNEFSTIEIVRKNGEEIVVLIDNDFYETAQKYHWQYYSSGYIRTSKFYGYIPLHRMVYEFFNNTVLSDNVQIDHVNGNTLDNRIENLRVCNIQENARNTRHRPLIEKSGVIGVRKDIRCKTSWRAQLYIDKDNRIEKTFHSKEEAILQRLIWEVTYFGEFSPQIDLIKAEYPYLLNYFKIKDNMKFSNDIDLISQIGASLKQDPHCPCMIVKNENTLCPCLPCRTKNHCHCGLFEKAVAENE